MEILTKQENKIAELIALECSEKQIADQLFISTKTVPVHKKNIRKKLKVKTNVGIAVKFLQSLEQPKNFVLSVCFLMLQLFTIVATPDADMRKPISARKIVKVKTKRNENS